MSDWKFGTILQDPSDGEMVMLISKGRDDSWSVIGLPIDGKKWFTPSDRVTEKFISEPTDWDLIDD